VYELCCKAEEKVRE
jgi:hypothetical protein